MIENWAATDKAKVFVSNCWIDTLQAFVPFPVFFFCLFPPSYNVILIKFYHATIGNV